MRSTCLELRRRPGPRFFPASAPYHRHVTHYEVLGVATDAPTAEVRRAYVRLARQHHPDYFDAAVEPVRLEAERRMRAINQAWNVLGNQARRQTYDASQGLSGSAADGARDDPGFRPFDSGDEDIDPHDLPDQPYRQGPGPDSAMDRALTLAPVTAFAASVGLLALSLVLGSAAVLALAGAALVVACLGFVVLPLLALSRASRDE